MPPARPDCIGLVELSRRDDHVDVGVVVEVGTAGHLRHKEVKQGEDTYARLDVRLLAHRVGSMGARSALADLVEDVSRIDVRSVRLDVLHMSMYCEGTMRRAVQLAGAPLELPWR